MSVISKLFTVLAFSAIVLSGLPGVSAQAQTSNTRYVITARNGVNVRDKNCNKVDSLGYETSVTYTTQFGVEPPIYCNMSGKNSKMIYVGYEPKGDGINRPQGAYNYVAEAFLQKVIAGGSYSGDIATVNATAGLNLRDEFCKRIRTVPNKTKLTRVGTDSPHTCKVAGKYYDMTPVSYNNNINAYWVASTFLK